MYIGDCFSNDYNKRDVKKHQFTTPFVYEVSSHWGIEISKYMDQRRSNKSKKKLIDLCKIMDSYLEKGDNFELYSCWVGEEKDKRVGERLKCLKKHLYELRNNKLFNKRARLWNKVFRK